MLESLQLQKVAREVFGKRLPKVQLDHVIATPFRDSDGDAALRITLVMPPISAEAISGDEALKLLVAMKDELYRQGEERFAIIEYATPDDMPAEEDQAD